MAVRIARDLRRRQLSRSNEGTSNSSAPSYNGLGNGYDGFQHGSSWWWTPAGLATRYGIVAILFAGLLIFFVGGYYHAQRRIKKGLQPYGYHGWMVRQPQNYYNPPRQRPVYAYYGDPNSQGYNMEGYPPPPPAYNNGEIPPPTYQPPPGASKAMADQSWHEVGLGEGSGSGSAGPAVPPLARS